jgi:MscS family membrane protein
MISGGFNKIFLVYCFIVFSAVSFDLSAQELQSENKNIAAEKSAAEKKAKDNAGVSKTEKKSDNSKTDGEKKHDIAGADAIVDHPIDTIKQGFNAWISKHIKIKEIEYWNILYLFCGILIFMIFARISRWVIEQHLIKLSKKTTTEVDDRVWEAVGKPVSLFIIAVGLYFSAGPLLSHLSPFLKNIYGRLCLATAATSVSWALYRLVSVIDHILTKLAEKTENNLDDLIVAIIRKSLKFTVVVLSVLFIGQNILAMNITALLAGAGVMGLAIAFAAQDTISNFFGSIMIILDQPFRVGDCIKIAGFTGSVENVGFRSTRIRTFDGHQISLPNKGVANDNIENVARRPFIKKVINLGLTYDTGYKNMEKAVTILHELLDKQPCMDKNRLPRIVFDSFNDFSLNISVTIWWHYRDERGRFIDPNYGEFMKWLHVTDMEILKKFDEAGLEFAFPTNTTYLAYDEKRKLSFDIDKKG